MDLEWRMAHVLFCYHAFLNAQQEDINFARNNLVHLGAATLSFQVHTQLPFSICHLRHLLLQQLCFTSTLL